MKTLLNTSRLTKTYWFMPIIARVKSCFIFFMQHGNHLRKQFVQDFQKIEMMSYCQKLSEWMVWLSCECSLCFVIMLFTSIKNEIPHDVPSSLGLCMYALIHKTKYEHDCSHELFKEFLSHTPTKILNLLHPLSNI